MFSETLPSLPITGSDLPTFFSGLPAGVCPQPTTAPSNKAISVSLMADPRIHQADQSISLLNDSLLDRDREHAVTVAGQGYWAAGNHASLPCSSGKSLAVATIQLRWAVMNVNP